MTLLVVVAFYGVMQGVMWMVKRGDEEQGEGEGYTAWK